MKRAVFLDRDGTIIEDLHYPREAEKVRLVPGAAEGLRELVKKGYLLFVVSNQSGVGRGIIKDHEFKAVHEKTCELLKGEGIEIAEFGYCFHIPDDECACRKPEIGLVPKKYQGESLDWTNSFVIGDKECDLELGTNIGATSYLVLTGKGKKSFEELSEAGRFETYRVKPSLVDVAADIPPCH